MRPEGILHPVTIHQKADGAIGLLAGEFCNFGAQTHFPYVRDGGVFEG